MPGRDESITVLLHPGEAGHAIGTPAAPQIAAQHGNHRAGVYGASRGNAGAAYLCAWIGVMNGCHEISRHEAIPAGVAAAAPVARGVCAAMRLRPVALDTELPHVT